MKILAIRISNLASLEGVTDIDFTREPLCSAGIFAITGPTGAGKSTILDALCLALYSRTPRYRQAKETGIGIHDIRGGTISQGDVRGILRDGAGEGFAEVDFVGTDNQRYRAAWSVKRARGKAEGQMQQDTLLLTNLATGAVFPGKKLETQKEIERVVGLNFEQFTRSVLLAQGDFTAFLKANKDEKASLLEKLTGMHIYSGISRLVFEKHKLAEQELRELHVQMSAITTLTEDGIQSLQEEREKLRVEAASLEKQILALGTELNWYQRLAELRSGLEQAEAAWAEAIAQKNNAGVRLAKLRRIEQVQHIRTWTDAIRQSKESQHRKTAEQEAAKHTLSRILQKKEQLKLRLEETETGLSQKLQARTDALPLIEEAKRLDTLIREKEAQAAAAREEAQDAGTKHRAHLMQIQSQKEEYNRLSAEINRLDSWRNENIARRAVAENHDLILSGLSDARQQLETIETCSRSLAEAGEKAAKIKQEMQALEMQAAAKEKESEEIRKEWEAQKQERSGISAPDLQHSKSETDARVEETIAAHAHWQMLFSALKEADTLQKNLDANRQDILRKEELVNQTAEQWSSAKIRKETSAKLLEKARMQTAENVETLRSHLVTGEACPVCGSTEHPLAGQNPELDKVMQSLEHEHYENEKACDISIKTYSAAQESCENLRKTIAQQEAEQVLKMARLRDLEESWSHFPVSRECAALSHEQKAGWLEERTRSLKSEQSDLLRQLRHFNASAQKLEVLAGQAEQHGKVLTGMINTIRDMERDILSATEKSDLLRQQKEKAADMLAGTEQNLSAYFPNTDWIANYRKDPGSFITRIGNFAQQWKENTGKLEQDIQRQKVLSATISGMESQLNAFNLDLEKKSASLSGLEKSYQELTARRKTIFEGKPAHIVEAEMQQDVDSARQDLAGLQKDWQDLNTSHTQTATQNDRLQKDLEEIAENLITFSGNIRDWLSDYNDRHGDHLEIGEIEDLLGFPEEWIETERAFLKSLEDGVTKTHSILSERKELWNQHRQRRVSDNTEESIRRQLDAARSTLNEVTRSLNEAGFRLQQDGDNRTKARSLQKIIENKTEAAENLSRLNEMIGSADGKKFRQIAQEYTLDVLLGYANIHLNMLTERYLLQRIPGSLGLQVTDRDMGDEVRTVYSLSGGESFLASLALALGLASLSSSRMKVESLFIDEGFGSLDPDTLNIAMDALERLYNQGRKVGVISHVREMTERIPTRIKVSKLASGKSKVEIDCF